MDIVGVTVGISCIWVAAVTIVFSILLVNGKIKPNPLYGIRFKASFKSDEAWYAINRYGGQQMITWAKPLVAFGVVALFMPLKSHPILAMAFGLGPVLFVLVPAYKSFRFAQRFGGTDE
jgi:hypothetical protein